MLAQTWQHKPLRVASVGQWAKWVASSHQTRQSDNHTITQLIRQSDNWSIDHSNLGIRLRASQLPSPYAPESGYACSAPVADTVGGVQRTHHCDSSMLTIASC